MGFREAVAQFFGMTLVERPPERALSAVEDAIDKIIHTREHPKMGAWRVPTVAEALSVPAILRSVSLISSTTGMLSMQGFRNGAVMDDPPPLIVRPDPYEAPGTFYTTTAANLAKYGEYVWWIASRDSDNQPTALVNVPLNELRVEENKDDRRFPKYKWGSRTGTRYSPANKDGIFVHRKYALTEPFALRGTGPLQLAKAAVSIAVEAQTFAANFYGDGGTASDIIKHAGMLDPTLRDEFGNPDPENGLSEADRLKAQYIARNSNTPLVIDQAIDSIVHPTIDQGGTQMLDSRKESRGDAALIFGIPGKFAEYVQSGTSLTYQNLEMAFTDLIKSCLQPLYLEPIEQDMSDLLTRSTVARFNVKGFLRADIKTRFEVHGIAIDKGIYGPEFAGREEGILPGDVEYAPVPFPAPSAIPTIPRVASTAMRDVRCPTCNRLLGRTDGRMEGWCRHCKALVAA